MSFAVTMQPPPLTMSVLGVGVVSVCSVSFFLGMRLPLPPQTQGQGLRVSIGPPVRVSPRLFHETSSVEAVADPLQFNAGRSDEANRGPGLGGRSCYLSWDGEPPEPGDDDDASDDDVDVEHLGPCHATYAARIVPSQGWTAGVDWFQLRNYGGEDREDTGKREECHIRCLEKLAELASADNILAVSHRALDEGKAPNTSDSRKASKWLSTSVLLVEASAMGLPAVVRLLTTDARFGPMDPLELPGHLFTPPGYEYSNLEEHREEDNQTVGLNAIQRAIIGGNAEVLAELLRAVSDHNASEQLPLDTVIDSTGRTAMEYLILRGSPIRPVDSKRYLGLDTTHSQTGQVVQRISNPSSGSGWRPSPESGVVNASVMSDRCDVDVVYGDLTRERFYRDYLITGRPLLLRGAVPPEDIASFHRNAWERTSNFHPTDSPCRVGPTAYPSLTDQKQCTLDFSIADIDQNKECPELPGTPMVHARHPNDAEFEELFPQYEGDPYDPKGGWRFLSRWFRRDVEGDGSHEPGWQVFFGGHGSGATLHWHNAALNTLYVGEKDWILTPPHYRGFTGMPAGEAAKLVIEKHKDVALRCTQGPGDLLFVPNYWGHLTINRGFAIGAATILPPKFQEEADIRPRIFFSHINKAGGTSVIRMLTDRCSDQYLPEHWGREPPYQRTFHATAHALIDRHGHAAWDDAYTFALVRHPLARVVSNYWFLVDQCQEAPRKSCTMRRIPRGLDMTTMTDEEMVANFHAYFHQLYAIYPPGDPHHYLFGSLGHGNEKFSTLNATQTSWLVDEAGKIAVKHIYKLEEMTENMAKLAKDLPCLGKSDSPGDGTPIEMEKENVTPKYPHYSLFGNDARTNQIMREVFGPDYTNFGYQ